MANPAHIQTLIDNANEVVTLIGLHVAVTGKGPGRRHGVEILNKSALVLLVACWESFVEDVATLGFDFLLEQSTSPHTFTDAVLSIASKELRTSQDSRKVWDLAGDGWKQVMRRHREHVLKEYAGKLNTPRPKQVNELVSKLVGLRNISSHWKWHGMPVQKAKDKLDALVSTRGEIAHRVRAGAYVRKEYVLETATFIQRLSAITSNRISTYIKKRAGSAPWPLMEYKSTH